MFALKTKNFCPVKTQAILIEIYLLPKDKSSEAIRRCIQTAEEDLRHVLPMLRPYLRSHICPCLSSPLQRKANRLLYSCRSHF